MKSVQGPLKVLRECMERNLEVRNTTRRDTAIRGQVTGYIAAFVKVWNIAIKGAAETWTRSKKKKIPALVMVSHDIPLNTAHLRMAALIVSDVDRQENRENFFVYRHLM